MFFTCLGAYAGPGFFGKHHSLYVGTKLKLNSAKQSFLKNRFMQIPARKNIVDCFSKYELDADYFVKMDGNVFSCTDVVPFERDKHTVFLKLENDVFGTIYYKYYDAVDILFPFDVVGEVIVPDGYFCGDIIKTYDKFDDEYTYSTPYSDAIVFSKVVGKKNTAYYMSVSDIGLTASFGSGVTILFEDGSRIEKNTEVNVKVNDNAKFVYSAFFHLTESDMEKILNMNMTDIRLYIEDVTVKMPFKYREYMKCLIAK